jgi:hypothetical protein
MTDIKLKPRSVGLSTLAESINSIKAELGKGVVVHRDRRTGKTLALLGFVHEYCSGFCYIVTGNHIMAKEIEYQYRHMFPDDEKPIVLTLDRVRDGCADGRPRCWVTDDVWPWVVERNSMTFETMEFLGGVGTSECMDFHIR